MEVTIGLTTKKYISTCFWLVIKSFHNFFNSFQNTQTSHAMSVCGNAAISTNECDATLPLNISTIPRTPYRYDSISDVSEPSQGPSHPSNTNSSPEEYGLVYWFHCYYSYNKKPTNVMLNFDLCAYLWGQKINSWIPKLIHMTKYSDENKCTVSIPYVIYWL